MLGRGGMGGEEAEKRDPYLVAGDAAAALVVLLVVRRSIAAGALAQRAFVGWDGWIWQE